MLNETINIACSADEKFAQHLCVTLYSLLDNISDKYDVCIYILDCGINDSSKINILKSLNKFKNQVVINFLEVNTDEFKEFKTTSHISRATYYRILLPQLLPNVNRIFYLDCDIVVKGDISEIYFVDLEGKYLGAVQDPNLIMANSYNEVVKIPNRIGYFNAGVLLIDLLKFRQNEITQKLFLSLKNTNTLTDQLDQTAMNAVLWDNWNRLSPEWNFLASLSVRGYKYTTYSKEEFLKAKANPKIIHYAGPIFKPWEYKSIGPFKHYYKEYLEKTNFKPKKFKLGFKELCSKMLYIIIFYFLPESILHYIKEKTQ